MLRSPIKEFLFLDKSHIPTSGDIADALSDAYVLWVEINREISAKYGDVIPGWKFYDKKSGWTMKNMLKNRNLFFFKPHRSHFTLTFIFGDRAVEEIERSAISEKIKAELRTAKRYMEGRGLTIKVMDNIILQDIYKLIDIKLKH